MHEAKIPPQILDNSLTNIILAIYHHCRSPHHMHHMHGTLTTLKYSKFWHRSIIRGQLNNARTTQMMMNADDDDDGIFDIDGDANEADEDDDDE